MNVQSCKSAERVFQVLALFREHKQPMRASYIAAQLDWPLSSTVVLLKSIERMGYLSFDKKSRTFYPSASLYHLGSWLMNERIADPELINLAHAVYDDTGNSTTLSIGHDTELEFVYSLNANLTPLAKITAGGRLPIQESVAGIAYLSGLADAQASRLIDELFARAPGGPDAKAAIRARVQKARQIGYACGPSPRFPGLVAFAQCIRSRMTGRPLVVAIGSSTRDLAEFEGSTRAMLSGKLKTYLSR